MGECVCVCVRVSVRVGVRLVIDPEEEDEEEDYDEEEGTEEEETEEEEEEEVTHLQVPHAPPWGLLVVPDLDQTQRDRVVENEVEGVGGATRKGRKPPGGGSRFRALHHMCRSRIRVLGVGSTYGGRRSFR